MESHIVRDIIANIRHPLDHRSRIKFTSRAIKLVTSLFEGKQLDVIDVHGILLRIAHSAGCLHQDTYITLKDVVTHLCMASDAVTISEIKEACKVFTVTKDNKYYEVQDMVSILSGM